MTEPLKMTQALIFKVLPSCLVVLANLYFILMALALSENVVNS